MSDKLLDALQARERRTRGEPEPKTPKTKKQPEPEEPPDGEQPEGES